eukprot:3599542-Rhodomonas_salina.2
MEIAFLGIVMNSKFYCQRLKRQLLRHVHRGVSPVWGQPGMHSTNSNTRFCTTVLPGEVGIPAFGGVSWVRSNRFSAGMVQDER